MMSAFHWSLAAVLRCLAHHLYRAWVQAKDWGWIIGVDFL